MDIIDFFSEDGYIDEAKIQEEIKIRIQRIIKSSEESSYHEDKINDLFINILHELSDFLTNKQIADSFYKFIKIMLNTLSSLGIEHVKLPLKTILEIMESAKKTVTSEKRSKTKRNKRNNIFDAAMIVFSQKGFHNANVDEIAELAGIAKGTIYRYFNSKEDILKELVNEKITWVANELRKIFNKDSDILALIKEAIAYYVDFCERNKELYRILIHTPWILRDINYNFYNDVITNLPMLKRRILALNLKGKIKTTNFYTVFYGIFGFVDGIMQKWFNDNCEYSLKEELPVIIEVLFYGFVGNNMNNGELPSNSFMQAKTF